MVAVSRAIDHLVAVDEFDHHAVGPDQIFQKINRRLHKVV